MVEHQAEIEKWRDGLSDARASQALLQMNCHRIDQYLTAFGLNLCAMTRETLWFVLLLIWLATLIVGTIWVLTSPLDDLLGA
jgi:hypothetical protein